PFLSESDAQRVRQKLVTYVLEAPPGCYVRLDDAYNLRTITALEIGRLKFDSPANRARQLARPLAALSQWFGDTKGTAVPAELKGSGALRAPEWLRQISAEAVDHPLAVMLIGSPLCRARREPAFSIFPGLYP